MKRIIGTIITTLAFLLAAGLTSCEEKHPDLGTDTIPGELFHACYDIFTEDDIMTRNNPSSGYIRQMWNAYELTTDEAVSGIGDEGIVNYCFNAYDASHPLLSAFFFRLYEGISLCNRYLQDYQSYDELMTAEVRFLRALHYYLLMDGWGNVPFLTGDTLDNAVRYSRSEMFYFIESELLEIEPHLSPARAKNSSDPDYGRVDKSAAWLLLARLYLNSEVYTGSQQYGKAAQYAAQVMFSPYRLNTTVMGSWSAYQMLFMADNGETDAAYEAIFPIPEKGMGHNIAGATFFLIASSHDADMVDSNGTTEAWGWNRARSDLVAKWFPSDDVPEAGPKDFAKAACDDRAIMDSRGRRINNEDLGDFKAGFAVAKYNNYTTLGNSTISAQFPDTDFFLMRAAEAYLTFAEASARQSGGIATGDAASAINHLRKRANAATKDIYTLDEICDEWSREFYFEGRRRMDLIRFGKYGGSSDYQWQWKGGSYAGRSFPEYLNLFPIPQAAMNATPGLAQNPGYR
ncbi:MAG: RagB/SusD family nutrient uptake outer membrane protein [Bacteroidales bacterium]|nr:RagB/SusD family nutrient uptake outer membrane protein [Bacteroidales bacterium]